MRNRTAPITVGLLAAIGLSLVPACLNAGSPAIPWSQIGAKAGADYKGDGLAVSPTAQGARLHCVFQRLDGEATPEGLWLSSTATNSVKDRFRVVAVTVGRVADGPLTPSLSPSDGERVADRPGEGQLPRTGTVAIEAQTVRFTRPGLVEEYRVSLDGVRQDFLVPARPAGAGELAVRLAVAGAQVEPAGDGARLVLTQSGRKIAYSRLRVTDARGKVLPVRIEIQKPSAFSLQPSAFDLAVVVNDAEAVYPVRIDPTFSDANWISMGGGPGVNGGVIAVAVDGAGNVYIGGSFIVVNDILANGIAKWNGSSWSALGSGIDGNVWTLAVSGSTLFAGGQFTTAGGIAATNIAQWDGSSWSALGSGMNGVVAALAVSGGTLYAGGGFGGGSIAQWNGSSWSALGSGMNGYVYALAVSGSTLFAGGQFTTAGGSAATNIAKWDGNSWFALGSGMNGSVSALAASGSDVYAGGSFTTAGGIAANNIAQWNGSSWSPLGSGISGAGGDGNLYVAALAVSGGTLYAGGEFTTAGGNSANNIAQWNGTNWTALGSGVSGRDDSGVNALAVLGSNLYAGGYFTTAGGSQAFSIARWDGSSWSGMGSMGSGMNGYLNGNVQALAVSGSDLYAGGEFTAGAGGPFNYIAKWDGNSWSALGSGMNDVVLCLAVSGSNVYAGGLFTTAGGSAANYIAQWNGSSWSGMGSGMNRTVEALAVSGNDLYAGGDFTTAGGSTVNYIAKWDGSSWSHMDAGISGRSVGEASYVGALAVSGNNVYAGGYFTAAGGVPANNIAQWDGSSWSALGSGIGNANYGVAALAASGSDVYAGAEFGVSKWDGSSWSDLDSGAGLPGLVFALAVSGSNVYAGGAYTTAPDGSPEPNIAQWDGNSWSLLGSGMNASVEALAVSGNDLYAGGEFTVAGGKWSEYIARANLLLLPTLSVSPSGNPQGGITVSWPSADTDGFSLEQADTLITPASWVSNTASITDDGTTRSVTLPATNSAQFFRLRGP